MKNCHVCNQLCEDDVELCPICGAYLLDDEENSEEIVEIVETNVKIEPVLLATFEDVVSAEIFKDVLTENGIPYSDCSEDSMRVVFGGSFSAEEIYVDKTDFDKAQALYEEFLAYEPEFEDGFFDEEEI